MSRSSRAPSRPHRATRSGRKSVEELLRQLDGGGELPSLPQIVVKLNAVAHDPKSSASDLANIILRDQSLTSRILQIANSALYASYSDKGIATVTQAVIVLGFQNVVRLAMGIQIVGILDEGERDHHLLRIWMHSIACAVASESLAQAVRLRGTEEAFVAGLLHDVGKLILLRFAPEKYRALLERAGAADGLEREHELLGHTHLDVGEAVARRWNLPAPLVDVIAHHHELGGPKDHLRHVVMLANDVAKVYYTVEQSGPSIRLADLERMASDRLGLGPDRLGKVLGSLRANVDECLRIFGLDEARGSRRAQSLGTGDSGLARVQEVLVKMEEDIHRKSAQLGLLREISHTLVRERDPEVLIPIILEALYVSLGLERVAIARHSTAGGVPVASPGFGPDLDAVRPLLELRGDDHPLADILRHDRPLNVVDVSMPLYGNRLGAWGWPAKAFAVVPVPGADGPIGALVADRGDSPLGEDDLEMMGLFANQLGLALMRSGPTD